MTEYSAEDIQLNRKRVVEALETGDENRRCTGTIIAESTFGTSVCAIGVALEGILGAPLTPAINGDADDPYFKFANSVGEELDRSGKDVADRIYHMNDRTDAYDNFVYSWKDIATMLRERWGI